MYCNTGNTLHFQDDHIGFTEAISRVNYHGCYEHAPRFFSEYIYVWFSASELYTTPKK